MTLRQTEDSVLPIIQAASANQNSTSTILREKPEEWPPSLACEPKRSNRVKDWWLKTNAMFENLTWVSLLNYDLLE